MAMMEWVMETRIFSSIMKQMCDSTLSVHSSSQLFPSTLQPYLIHSSSLSDSDLRFSFSVTQVYQEGIKKVSRDAFLTCNTFLTNPSVSRNTFHTCICSNKFSNKFSNHIFWNKCWRRLKERKSDEEGEWTGTSASALFQREVSTRSINRSVNEKYQQKYQQKRQRSPMVRHRRLALSHRFSSNFLVR